MPRLLTVARLALLDKEAGSGGLHKNTCIHTASERASVLSRGLHIPTQSRAITSYCLSSDVEFRIQET